MFAWLNRLLGRGSPQPAEEPVWKLAPVLQSSLAIDSSVQHPCMWIRFTSDRPELLLKCDHWVEETFQISCLLDAPYTMKRLTEYTTLETRPHEILSLRILYHAQNGPHDQHKKRTLEDLFRPPVVEALFVVLDDALTCPATQHVDCSDEDKKSRDGPVFCRSVKQFGGGLTVRLNGTLEKVMQLHDLQIAYQTDVEFEKLQPNVEPYTFLRQRLRLFRRGLPYVASHIRKFQTTDRKGRVSSRMLVDTVPWVVVPPPAKITAPSCTHTGAVDVSCGHWRCLNFQNLIPITWRKMFDEDKLTIEESMLWFHDPKLPRQAVNLKTTGDQITAEFFQAFKEAAPNTIDHVYVHENVFKKWLTLMGLIDFKFATRLHTHFVNLEEAVSFVETSKKFKMHYVWARQAELHTYPTPRDFFNMCYFYNGCRNPDLVDWLRWLPEIYVSAQPKNLQPFGTFELAARSQVRKRRVDSYTSDEYEYCSD